MSDCSLAFFVQVILRGDISEQAGKKPWQGVKNPSGFPSGFASGFNFFSEL